MCLIRRGVVGDAIPPISLALATNRKDYISCLMEYESALDEEEVRQAVNDWVSCFAAATSIACADIRDITNDLERIRSNWVSALGKIRVGSSLDLLLDAIQVLPIFSVETMARQTGRSKQAINEAVSRLCEAGVVIQTTKGKRNRVFEVPDVLEEFNLVERLPPVCRCVHREARILQDQRLHLAVDLVVFHEQQLGAAGSRWRLAPDVPSLSSRFLYSHSCLASAFAPI